VFWIRPDPHLFGCPGSGFVLANKPGFRLFKKTYCTFLGLLFDPLSTLRIFTNGSGSIGLAPRIRIPHNTYKKLDPDPHRNQCGSKTLVLFHIDEEPLSSPTLIPFKIIIKGRRCAQRHNHILQVFQHPNTMKSDLDPDN
jgi:hypothetical protein